MIQEEDTHLLEMVEGPYRPRIEHSREEYFVNKKEKGRRICCMKRPNTMRTSGCGERKKNYDSYKNKRKLQRMGSQTHYALYQGSNRSWKTWKVMEFMISISRPGKSWNFSESHGKSWKSNMLSENKEAKR